MINAQGEDVVAGIRTPQQITLEGSQRWAVLQGISEEERAAKYPSLEEAMPELYTVLNETQQKLEDHYSDMQDLEFTRITSYNVCYTKLLRIFNGKVEACADNVLTLKEDGKYTHIAIDKIIAIWRAQ